MINIFKKLFPGNADRRTYNQRLIESYLSQSTDLFDLERRERELERNGYFWL